MKLNGTICSELEYTPDQRSLFSCHHRRLVQASVQTGESGPHSTAFLLAQPRITSHKSIVAGENKTGVLIHQLNKLNMVYRTTETSTFRYTSF